MTTLFIADLHLSQEAPAITAGFIAFLQREAIHADALYILGDLFEVWVGDDEPSSLHDRVADALAELKQHNVPCYFIHGNRDFMLGKRFANRSGMVILPEEQVITPYGQPLLILHGDTLCTDDVEYLKFRGYMYNPLLRWLFRRMPLSIRQKIGQKIRGQSQNANQVKPKMVMDVNPDTVQETLRRHHCTLMIHGHTHRPAIHPLILDGQPATRIVLGAWHDNGSVVRLHRDGSYELISFPF